MLTPGISESTYDAVKPYDCLMLHAEAYCLLSPIPAWVKCDPFPVSCLPIGHSWEAAERMFLRRAEELGLEIG
jgi:hypothetical protein